MSWHHSGFHVHIGERIWPEDEKGLENLARYIIRACFSQERMVYIPVTEATDGVAKVIYTSKDGKTRKTFDALDWLAHLVTHVPGRYEQTVRYYGYYSNKSRGMRKKAETDDAIPVILKNDISSKKWRQNWARLIQKVYEVDPLICPKCQGKMRIIAFIEDEQLIKKILKHLDLWEIRNHGPPDRDPTHIPELTYDDDYSQIPTVDYWIQ
ncbi:transposase [Desulfosarcina ovata]|uniref:transposase n=2 Tax=Desulfosarcina ovata TaxID=83564 RepID=UPI0012D3093B|nr:transposase [Desulfosarcina ovata]